MLELCKNFYFFSDAQVTSTDIPKALDSLKKNIEENLRNISSEKYNVTIEPLIWGKENDKSFKIIYDVILGADLIYDESVFDDLIETFNLHSDKSTEIYLAVRIRYERDQKFLDKLKLYFNIEEIFYDNIRDVHLFLCKKEIG